MYLSCGRFSIEMTTLVVVTEVADIVGEGPKNIDSHIAL